MTRTRNEQRKEKEKLMTTRSGRRLAAPPVNEVVKQRDPEPDVAPRAAPKPPPKTVRFAAAEQVVASPPVLEPMTTRRTSRTPVRPDNAAQATPVPAPKVNKTPCDECKSRRRKCTHFNEPRQDKAAPSELRSILVLRANPRSQAPNIEPQPTPKKKVANKPPKEQPPPRPRRSRKRERTPEPEHESASSTSTLPASPVSLATHASDNDADENLETLNLVRTSIHYTSRLPPKTPPQATVNITLATQPPTTALRLVREAARKSLAHLIYAHPSHECYSIGLSPTPFHEGLSEQWWVGKSRGEMRAGPFASEHKIEEETKKAKRALERKEKSRTLKAVRENLAEAVRRQEAGERMWGLPGVPAEEDEEEEEYDEGWDAEEEYGGTDVDMDDDNFEE